MGVMRISKANFFSGLNNFSEHGIESKKFSQYFGITEKELNFVLEICLENND